MDSLIDPILLHILRYLTFYEIANLSCVNKQVFQVKKQLLLLKPPNGRFVSTLVKLNNSYFETGDTVACSNRFSSAGCSIVQIRKLGLVREEEDEDDPQIQVSLTLTAERGVSRGVIEWNEDQTVTVQVKGFFNTEEPDGQYDTMLNVLNQVYVGMDVMFDAPIVMGHILDYLVDRIFSLLVIEKHHGNNNTLITLDQVREVIPIVFPGELAKYALLEGNKQVGGTPSVIVDLNAVHLQILFRFPNIQIEKEFVSPFITGILEYICAEIWELAGNEVRDNGDDVLTVDHMVKAIEGDPELRETIKFDPLWLVNQAREEHLIKGTIKSEDSKSVVVIETDPFPIRFRKVANAQVLELYHLHQTQTNAIEGVLVVDNIIPSDLHNSLMNNLKIFAKYLDITDYRLGNQRIIRYNDPGLYCYVQGASHFIPSADLSSATHQQNDNENHRDLWGRPYETSRFQFLPAYIDPQEDGSYRFRNEINNLPKKGHESLYQNLEELFALSVPYLEQVVGYAETLGGKDVTAPELQFFSEDSYSEKRITADPYIKPYKLKGKSLQVICKIGEIELQPGQVFEEEWHVEGVANENIIAIIDYTVEWDESIVGADLRFKRAFLAGEVTSLYDTGKERTLIVDNMIERGMCPLGTAKLIAGRLIVFPNSHVQKVFQSKNEGDSVAKARRVIFFLVNPEVRIISTQEVTPESQQQRIAIDEARQYRFDIMSERKFHKQDWNVREINLPM